MTCQPSPIALRIGNVSLSNNKVARGIEMAVGDPPQPVALMPVMPLNKTLLFGPDGYCLSNVPGPGSWTNAGCTTFRGGAYNTLASRTQRSVDANTLPDDTAPDTVNAGGGHYPKVSPIADTLWLGASNGSDSFSLANYSMGVALSDWGEQGYAPMMALGLGANSSLLQTLRSSGQIASRSWGFFWGRSGPGRNEDIDNIQQQQAQQLDGSFVVGGYDRAKVSGQGFTQPLTATVADCPSQMVVAISDLVLNFANGTDASIFNTSTAPLQACITPNLPTLMRLPLEPYFGRLLQLNQQNIFQFGRSLGIYYWNLRYITGIEPYDGDLTLKLQSGFSARIASRQLVVPHVVLNQTTGDFFINSSHPADETDFVIDSLQSTQSDDMPQIGWQLFSTAYLHVNQDTRSFTLWQANPTTRQDLVAVDTQGNVLTKFCTSNDTNSSTSFTATANGLSSGFVAGITVAAVFIFGILAGLAGWCVFRRRRQRQVQQEIKQQRQQQQQRWQEESQPYQQHILPPDEGTYKHSTSDGELYGSDVVLALEIGGFEVQRRRHMPRFELPG